MFLLDLCIHTYCVTVCLNDSLERVFLWTMVVKSLRVLPISTEIFLKISECKKIYKREFDRNPLLLLQIWGSDDRALQFLKWIFVTKFYLFRAVLRSIIGRFSLYKQLGYMSYRFADGLRANCQQNHYVLLSVQF